MDENVLIYKIINSLRAEIIAAKAQIQLMDPLVQASTGIAVSNHEIPNSQVNQVKIHVAQEPLMIIEDFIKAPMDPSNSQISE